MTSEHPRPMHLRGTLRASWPTPYRRHRTSSPCYRPLLQWQHLGVEDFCYMTVLTVFLSYYLSGLELVVITQMGVFLPTSLGWLAIKGSVHTPVLKSGQLSLPISPPILHPHCLFSLWETCCSDFFFLSFFFSPVYSRVWFGNQPGDLQLLCPLVCWVISTSCFSIGKLIKTKKKSPIFDWKWTFSDKKDVPRLSWRQVQSPVFFFFFFLHFFVLIYLFIYFYLLALSFIFFFFTGAWAFKGCFSLSQTGTDVTLNPWNPIP